MELNWPVVFDLIAKIGMLMCIIAISLAVSSLQKEVADLKQMMAFDPTPDPEP